jgi:hypothetical protein
MKVVRQLTLEETQSYNGLTKAVEYYTDLLDISRYIEIWKEIDFKYIELYIYSVIQMVVESKCKLNNFISNICTENQRLTIVDNILSVTED